ncbi:hypothetical protein ACQ856_18165 [Mycolicibacterium psychrotolerans]|uniref:hypothetical protein n=1 Tax=Mycolicibacterium psychrotolerans TaxID=216929 RepID=UPI003D66CCE3
MIDIQIHPDVRNKYVVTVADSASPRDDILLSSTSQGYENVDAPERMVRRLFGYPPPYLSAEAIAELAADGARMPEPVQLTVTYVNGTKRGPERLR